MPEITGNNSRTHQRIEAIQSIAESSLALMEPILTAQAEFLRVWADSMENLVNPRRSFGSDERRRFPSASE